MKRRRTTIRITLLAGLLLTGCSHVEATGPAVVDRGADTAEPELAGVERVVQDYLAGFRDGDRAAFDRVFAAGSMHILRQGDGEAAVKATAISQRLPVWSANPDPHARLENLRIIFTSPNLALADFRLRHRGRVYNDQLNLFRFGDAWQVAVKVTEIPSAAP
jgi:hypothetical protein